MKHILVLYYSQTGQLTRAVRSMIGPLENDPGVKIVWENLQPKKPYPYPWPVFDFIDAFPESVYMDPPLMEPVSFNPDTHFDLIILAYQVWFLSPSLPVTGFLRSDAARVLKDTPVITLIACRNMWICAHEKMKILLTELGAKLIDNVVLVDQGPPLLTFITTPRWLLTGKRDGFWGIFPPAGISEKDIDDAARFGRVLKGSLDKLGPAAGSLLWGLGAVKVNPGYITSEKIAHRSFYIWGNLFRSIGLPGNPLRRALLIIYTIFLITMILTVVPLGVILRLVLSPFSKRKMDARVLQIEQPSGSSTERILGYL